MIVNRRTPAEGATFCGDGMTTSSAAQEYGEIALAALTWQNLGFRFAQRFPERTKEDALNAYEVFASLY
jgi:hypothetical protein